MATLQSGKCFTVPTLFGMCCRSEWQERMYIYKWHEVDQTKHEIFCSYCLQWSTSQSKFRNHYFFYLRFHTVPTFSDLGLYIYIYIYIYIDIYIYIYIYIYTGACHIIRISSKSWFISLIPFKKWNLYNVYIHSTQTDIFQVFISFNFDDYNWQLMKTPNSVSQKIRILLKTNTKKGFLEILANWKVWTWKVWACTALNT